MSPQDSTLPQYEYIVVGSGAGGGTVAARLAEAGHTVLLLEAGGDPRQLTGSDPIDPEKNRLPDDYDVPCFHAFASENDAMKWDFFVRHYENDEAQKLDPKFVETHDGQRVDGILYPRAGTLGGCTAHNAMIFVYPHDEDWNHIAKLTGDASWKAGKMRSYFQKVENCHYRWFHRLLSYVGINPTRHGWRGWLQTECAIPLTSLGEEDLLKVLIVSIKEAIHEIGHILDRVWWLFQSFLDPNDWRTVKENSIGLR